MDDDDKLNNESLSGLGQRGGWLINESGLYSLILSSKLPTAKTAETMWMRKIRG
ncbi:MAG: BRO family protein [Butyricicoccaceae bacterium]